MHKYNFKKYYFISEYDTNQIINQDKSTNIIFRNYNDKLDYKKIIKLRNFCKKRGNKFFLSNDFKLAINLKLDGVYLPSFNKNFKHLAYNLRKNFLVLGSAHTLKEIKIKKIQAVNTIFLSSIFKKNKNYLGLNKFKNLSSRTNLNIIALGGISNDNIKLLGLVKIFGFAGISYFKKKGPYK